ETGRFAGNWRAHAQNSEREYLGATGRRCRSQGLCSEERVGSGIGTGHSQGGRGRNRFRSPGRTEFARQGRGRQPDATRTRTAAGDAVFDPEEEQNSPVKGERDSPGERDVRGAQMIVCRKSNKEIGVLLTLRA